jgi:hypothetical protein
VKIHITPSIFIEIQVISKNKSHLTQLLITLLPALLPATTLQYSFAGGQLDDEMLEDMKDSVVREEPTIKDPNLKPPWHFWVQMIY